MRLLTNTRHLLGGLTLLLANTLLAHPMWIVPSEFSVSGDSQWLTFTTSASNTLFAADKPLEQAGMAVVAPNGKPLELNHFFAGQRSSVFDLELVQQGTYRVEYQRPVFYYTSYQQDGEKKGLRADKQQAQTELPDSAIERHTEKVDMKTTLYITRNAPSDEVMTPSGRGFEITPLTHLNDIVAGDVATFRLTLNGKAAVNYKVELTPAGSRYRDQRGVITLISDDRGDVHFDVPQAGIWFLAAAVSLQDESGRADSIWSERFITFEAIAE